MLKTFKTVSTCECLPPFIVTKQGGYQVTILPVLKGGDLIIGYVFIGDYEIEEVKMKTIGLIGGMSWESTAIYYKELNLAINRTLGGLNSAKIRLTSVNFEDVAALQKQGAWDDAGKVLGEEAKKLEDAGANYILICTNTMHKVAEQVQEYIQVPILHIADATGQKIKAEKYRKVGLLGTQFTMSQPFYKDRLYEKFNIEAITPEQAQKDEVHRIIFEELCLGQCLDESKKTYLNIIKSMQLNGAEAIILGCTEIGMLIQQEDLEEEGVSLPVYDTTMIHVEAAVKAALSE